MPYPTALHGFWGESRVNNSGGDRFTDLIDFPYLGVFEEDSKHMIRSCLHIKHKMESSEWRFDEFDYSLCAVGFWKSVELELNIVVADAIRKIKGFIDDIPSGQIPVRGGQCKVICGFQTNAQPVTIDLNRRKRNSLMPVMFGSLIGLCSHYQENGYVEVLLKLQEEMDMIANLNEFMDEFVNQLVILVRQYRNQGSHLHRLNSRQYDDLFTLLFQENGLMQRVSTLKEGVLSIL